MNEQEDATFQAPWPDEEIAKYFPPYINWRTPGFPGKSVKGKIVQLVDVIAEKYIAYKPTWPAEVREHAEPYNETSFPNVRVVKEQPRDKKAEELPAMIALTEEGKLVARWVKYSKDVSRTEYVYDDKGRVIADRIVVQKLPEFGKFGGQTQSITTISYHDQPYGTYAESLTVHQFPGLRQTFKNSYTVR